MAKIHIFLISILAGATVFGQGPWIMTGRVHNELNWNTITTEHYRVHYHHGIEEFAKQGASMAEQMHATLLKQVGLEAAPVIDMLRRAAPGQTFRLAIYGMSPSSPEFKAIRAAVERGVKARVVIYSKYNGKAIDALRDLKDAGYDVDARIIKSRVMHEKFGVVGDDVFNGSANLSTSSITKHSEDRFFFRNMPKLADRFVEEFATLWARGRAI